MAGYCIHLEGSNNMHKAHYVTVHLRVVVSLMSTNGATNGVFEILCDQPHRFECI